jgi:hypothetical protein
VESSPITRETAHQLLKANMRLFATKVLLNLCDRGYLHPEWGAKLHDDPNATPSAFPLDAIDLDPIVDEILYLLRIHDEPPNANYPGYQCHPPDANS